MAGAPILQGDCRDCPEATTSIATTGLCLDDATPIAIVVTRDCNGVVTEDGWLDLTTGIFTPGPPPPGTAACTTDNYDFALSGWLCDILPDGSVAGIALVQIERNASGAVIGITLIGVDGLPYVPVGIMTRCPEDRLAAEVLCDAGAAGIPFVRFYTYSPVGSIPARDTDLDGAPYVVVGPVVRCIEEVTGTGGDPVVVDVNNWRDDAEYVVLCDQGTADAPFVRRFDVSDTGVVTATDTELDGTTAYFAVGPVGVCALDLGSIQVVADPDANVRAGMVLLSGVGDSWTLGVDSGGGKVKSITIVRRAGGTAASVTVADDFGNVTAVISGESLTWGVSALEDEITGTFVVATTNAGDRVLVLWTEV
jgi:hypothetical protein